MIEHADKIIAALGVALVALLAGLGKVFGMYRDANTRAHTQVAKANDELETAAEERIKARYQFLYESWQKLYEIDRAADKKHRISQDKRLSRLAADHLNCVRQYEAVKAECVSLKTQLDELASWRSRMMSQGGDEQALNTTQS